MRKPLLSRTLLLALLAGSLILPSQARAQGRELRLAGWIDPSGCTLREGWSTYQAPPGFEIVPEEVPESVEWGSRITCGDEDAGPYFLLMLARMAGAEPDALVQGGLPAPGRYPVFGETLPQEAGARGAWLGLWVPARHGWRAVSGVVFVEETYGRGLKLRFSGSFVPDAG